MTEITDLTAVGATGDGVAWSCEPTGVNVNLVVLGPGGAIAEHRNDGVGVLLVAVAGSATVTIDDEQTPIAAGDACLVPVGARRGVVASQEGVRYLTVHAARGPLQIATGP